MSCDGHQSLGTLTFFLLFVALLVVHGNLRKSKNSTQQVMTTLLQRNENKHFVDSRQQTDLLKKTRFNQKPHHGKQNTVRISKHFH